MTEQAVAPPRPSTTTMTTTLQLLAGMFDPNATGQRASDVTSMAEASFLESTKTIVLQGSRELIAGASHLNTSISRETAMGTQTIQPMDAIERNNGRMHTLTPVAGGPRVAFDDSFLQALPRGTFISMLTIQSNRTLPGSKLSRYGGGQGELQLQVTTAFDITLVNSAGNEVELPRSLWINFPEYRRSDTDDEGNFLGAPNCHWLEEDKPFRWSQVGVRRAAPGEVEAAGLTNEGMWCIAEHLTIFAVLSDLLHGCLNVELWTDRGIEALSQRHDWWQGSPAVLVIGVTSTLVLIFSLGLAREWHALEDGWFPASRDHVCLCKKFMQWGPQLIKHKYAAIAVYAKDVFQCFLAGRNRLRRPTFVGAVQRALAVRTGVSTACLAQSCWGGAGWFDATLAMPVSVHCEKLEIFGQRAEKVALEDVLGSCYASRFQDSAKRFLFNLVAIHPFIEVTRIGAGSLTVRKRAALQAGTTFGVLATYSIILNITGSVRNWQAAVECPISPTSHLFVLIATLASIVCNAVPNAFLQDMARQTHARPLWNLTFWLLTVAYLSGAAFTVAVAMANLNPADQDEWYRCLEWAMAIRFIGLPIAQAIRHSIMFEFFIREEDPEKREGKFMVACGLRSPYESRLSPEGQEVAERMSRQAISAEDLLHFTALLGDRVMPDFQAESTCTDVIEQAIQPLCTKPPSLERYPLQVEVVEIRGLASVPFRGDSHLRCSVVHLGPQSFQDRAVIGEFRSEESLATTDGSVKRCTWCFESLVPGVTLEHAIGFEVKDGDCVVGVSYIAAEEFLRNGGYEGELLLHPPESAEDSAERGMRVPSKTSSVVGRAFTASQRSDFQSEANSNDGNSRLSSKTSCRGSTGYEPERRVGTPTVALAQTARLRVKVLLPFGYLQTLALHERRKLLKSPLQDQSEVPTDSFDLQAQLIQMASEATEHGNAMPLSCGAFCEPVDSDSETLPVDRIVSHSPNMKYIDLAATILVDALCDEKAYESVLTMLQKGNFHDILDMLRQSGRHGTRYWISMFSTDVLEGSRDLCPNEKRHWHQELLSALPTVFRQMRMRCCRQMVHDIKAKEKCKVSQPVHLLVLDEDLLFMQEATNLSKMALLKSLRSTQKAILHPDHLRSSNLGFGLRRLSKRLGDDSIIDDADWTEDYLVDRQNVYDTMRDLVVQAVKLHRDDDEATWSDLNLVGIYTAIGMMSAGRKSQSEGQDEACGADEMGGMDGEVDVDLS